MFRDVGYMTEEVFYKAVYWVKYFANEGTQLEVNLFGVGEPLMNPKLIQYVAYARKHLPIRIPLHLNTNGKLMTKIIAVGLKSAGITSIDVTGHNARYAANTIRILDDVGIPFKVSFDPITAPNNWAGQVNWFEPRYPKPYPCPWIGRGQVMIMSTGDVTRCCLDAFARGILCNVLTDNLSEVEVTPFALCDSCHHTLDKKGDSICQP